MSSKGTRQALAAVTCAALTAMLGACSQSGDSASAPSAELKEQLREQSATYASMPASQLRSNVEAMQVGKQLFSSYCASCHGADGQGGRHAPDLTLGRFDYGTSEDAVRTTIADGRQSQMPAMGHDYGEVEIGLLVAYVLSFSADKPPTADLHRGKELYAQTCATCHGPEGQGDPAKGVPSLADEYWQHGNSMMNVRLVITRGILEQCPGHKDTLTPAEIELLTAFVRDRLVQKHVSNP